MDYISCRSEVNCARKRDILIQPHIIKTLVQKMETIVKGIKFYQTPGTLGLALLRTEEN